MSREAIKLALEALEYIHKGANNQGPHTGISWLCVSNKSEPAITALREALAEQPAQRTWVNATTWRGLTDEEIDAATQAWAGAVRVSLNRLILCREFARAIEAKLKEKNNG